MLDTAPLLGQAAPPLPAHARAARRSLRKGAYFVALAARAWRAGARRRRRARAEGDERVTALALARRQRETHASPATPSASATALRSETQLADLAGCALRLGRAATRPGCRERDAAGRSSVRGVYLAGDGAGILGADAAELGGRARRAGAAGPIAACAVDAIARRSAASASSPRSSAFASGLETRLPVPRTTGPPQAPDDLIVCRCEEITAGELRACVRDTGARRDESPEGADAASAWAAARAACAASAAARAARRTRPGCR